MSFIITLFLIIYLLYSESNGCKININIYKNKEMNIKNLFNEYMYFNEDEKEKFHDSIKDKLSYSILTKKGIRKSMFLKEYKNNYKLSLEQKEALIGIMLGDGYLDRKSPTYNTRLRLEQSYPEKKNCLLSLFELYKPLVVNYPNIIYRKPDKRTGKIYPSIAFRTSAFHCLNEYHDLFYRDKIKIVPKDIQKYLTARGLAY